MPEEKIAVRQPLYCIGETVYLRDSAALGFIEAYVIKLPHYEPNGDITYELVTQMKPHGLTHTIGDRITGQPSLPLRLPEQGLVTYAEALDLAIDNLTLQLNQLQAQRDALG
jgi:hypothetical protein